MSMSIGGATIGVTKSKHGGMEFYGYKNELEAVLALIDNGSFGGGFGYGCEEHINALIAVEKRIEAVRERMMELEIEEDGK